MATLPTKDSLSGPVSLRSAGKMPAKNDGSRENVVCLRAVLTGAALDRIASKLSESRTKQRRAAMAASAAANLN